MSKRAALFLLLTLSALLAAPIQAQDAVSDLLARINNLRSSLGLYLYTYNTALAAAAQSQAQWMADTQNVSHTRLDGSTPQSRAVAAGYGTTAVSENIYGGTLATPDAAWEFWINSSIHYAGLTSIYYSEIGIGAASAPQFSAFVLVFGNPGGPAPALPVSADDDVETGGSSGGGEQPAYVVGVNEDGYIMHQIQPGDTVGQIALIYGYSWDDIPMLMELNGITDPADLDIGAIFLVPPHAGTYTPTVGGPTATATETAPPATLDAQLTVDAGRVLTAAAIATYTVTPLPLLGGGFSNPAETPIPEVAAFPTETAEATPSVTSTTEATNVAMLPTAAAVGRSETSGDASPNWVLIAVIVQLGVLVLAGTEFVLRGRRQKARRERRKHRE